ncbi:MAG: MurR/RpiR family transcriptional regulator [Succinivibrio sp.]|nr:MurR/RpiR family transcriptional regulator [Succinivibrio sp.]
MSILEQIQDPQTRSRFSRADQKLIEYFLNSELNDCSASISAIAQRTGVSHATVTRFARKFSFDSLKEFRSALLQEKELYKDELSAAALEVADSSKLTSRKLLQLNFSLLSKSMDELDYDSLRRLVVSMSAARHIFFFGLGGAGFIAADAARKFTGIGRDCRSASDIQDILMNCPLMGAQDVVLFVSTAGKMEDLLRAAAHCKERGVTLAVITSDDDPQLSALCGITLRHYMEQSDGAPVYSDWRMSVFYLIDLIYIELFKLLSPAAFSRMNLAAQNLSTI